MFSKCDNCLTPIHETVHLLQYTSRHKNTQINGICTHMAYYNMGDSFDTMILKNNIKETLHQNVN